MLRESEKATTHNLEVGILFYDYQINSCTHVKSIQISHSDLRLEYISNGSRYLYTYLLFTTVTLNISSIH